MGYSEIHCHLCGVSFNIGRVRCLNEPVSAGWDPSGYSYVCGPAKTYRDRGDGCAGEYVDEYEKKKKPQGQRRSLRQKALRDEADGEDDSRDEDEKCMFVNRFLQEQREMPAWQRAKSTNTSDATSSAATADKDDPKDEDFSLDDELESDEEPLEYDSEIEDDSAAISPVSERAPRETWLESFFADTYQHDKKSAGGSIQGWYKAQPQFAPQNGSGYHPHRNFRSMSPPRARNVQLEHIAAPGCDLDGAYNGHFISAEEMRGCTTIQCLVRKQPGIPFVADGETFEEIRIGNHEPFELTGEFFLSGLSKRVPSRDWGNPKLFPKRHYEHCSQPENYIDEPQPENFFFRGETAVFESMPFHPACLEVYKRISQHDKRYGHGGDTSAAIHDLTSWWTVDAGLGTFDRRRSCQDVYNCAEQWWSHKTGTEYLAANPLFVPRLHAILQSVIADEPGFDVRGSAFAAFPTSSRSSSDPFSSLPSELRMLLLSHLASRDIANLRLASQSFVHLPISFFHLLIRREMPWLWEAWGPSDPASTPYSFWASADPDNLEYEFSKLEHERQATTDYVQLVAEEYPEQREDLLERRRKWEVESSRAWVARFWRSESPMQLPPHRTNWYKLYCEITRHWAELKGLKNRARIWADCQNILHMITDCRDRGDFPVPDIPALVEEGYARKRAEREAWEAEARKARGES